MQELRRRQEGRRRRKTRADRIEEGTSDLIFRTKVWNFNLLLFLFITVCFPCGVLEHQLWARRAAIEAEQAGGRKVPAPFWEPLFAQALFIQGRSVRMGIFAPASQRKTKAF